MSLNVKVGVNMPQLSGVARDIVCDLLDALTIPVPPEESAVPSVESDIAVVSTAAATAAVATTATTAPAAPAAPAVRRYAGRNVRQQELIRNSSSNDLLNHEAEEPAEENR